MPQSWEQYNRWANPEGGSADFNVDLKHSLWSADVETWQERAPEVLKHLRDMYENTLHLTLAPQREIRFGNVLIKGTSECEDAPGDLDASGTFLAEWDEGPPTVHTFVVHATSVQELLTLIDKEEETLIEMGKG